MSWTKGNPLFSSFRKKGGYLLFGIVLKRNILLHTLFHSLKADELNINEKVIFGGT